MSFDHILIQTQQNKTVCDSFCLKQLDLQQQSSEDFGTASLCSALFSSGIQTAATSHKRYKETLWYS